MGIILLLLNSGISLANLEEKHGLSTIIIVDDDGTADYTSIQEAIDHADHGDTIYVRNGTYYEELIIQKNYITLQGEDRNQTIIHGNNTNRMIITVNGDHFTIRGFTICNTSLFGGGGIGILIQDKADSSLIVNNIIKNTYLGITNIYYNETNTQIRNNLFFNNFQAILLTDSQDLILSKNHFYNNSYGIHIQLCSESLINYNSFDKCNKGISLYSSSYNIISSNRFTDISFMDLSMQHSSNNLIELNDFKDYIEIISSHNNNFLKNNFYMYDSYQIHYVAYIPPMDGTRPGLINKWNQNYWGEAWILPYPIFGEIYITINNQWITSIGFVNYNWINAK